MLAGEGHGRQGTDSVCADAAAFERAARDGRREGQGEDRGKVREVRRGRIVHVKRRLEEMAWRQEVQQEQVRKAFRVRLGVCACVCVPVNPCSWEVCMHT